MGGWGWGPQGSQRLLLTSGGTCSSKGEALTLSCGLVPRQPSCPAVQVGTWGERGLCLGNAEARRQDFTKRKPSHFMKKPFPSLWGAGVTE